MIPCSSSVFLLSILSKIVDIVAVLRSAAIGTFPVPGAPGCVVVKLIGAEESIKEVAVASVPSLAGAVR
jgi:hypothetical protein